MFPKRRQVLVKKKVVDHAQAQHLAPGFQIAANAKSLKINGIIKKLYRQ